MSDLNPSDDRFARGWQKIKEIDGDAGQRVIDALKDVAPDLARYTVEFPFGDVYSRGVLSLKEREIATVAALTALGHAQPQLKVHIHGALNVGCTRDEVIEVIIQMAVYAGFPAALNAAFSAKEVFSERDSRGLKP
jgi:4-carboxymuconolactone decarboxylase